MANFDTDGLVTVVYPMVVDGVITKTYSEIRRSELVARLDGLDFVTNPLREDPLVVVVALVDDLALRAWLTPEQYRALQEADYGAGY